MSSDVDQQQVGTALALVLFKVGQHCFGVEAASVRGSGGVPGDGVLPVESLLTLPGSTDDRRQSLTIKGDRQDYAISVAAPVELGTIPAEAVHPLPVAITARCRLPGLRALAVADHSLILLVVLHRLRQTSPKADLLQDGKP